MMKYKLKENINFDLVNNRTIDKYNFSLEDYFNKETRMFDFPKGYVEFHLMGEVFVDYLLPLNLVEEIEGEDDK